MPLVASHLFNKGFKTEFIAHLLAVVCVLGEKVRRQPCTMLLSATKDQLRV